MRTLVGMNPVKRDRYCMSVMLEAFVQQQDQGKVKPAYCAQVHAALQTDTHRQMDGRTHPHRCGDCLMLVSTSSWQPPHPRRTRVNKLFSRSYSNAQRCCSMCLCIYAYLSDDVFRLNPDSIPKQVFWVFETSMQSFLPCPSAAHAL